MTTVEVWRSGWTVEHGGVSGELSEVWGDDKLLCWAVERTTQGWCRLKLGSYTIRMELSQTFIQDGGPRKQFRVHGHDIQGGKAGMLIHVANYPDELEGCIAPGLTPTDEGVKESRQAMAKLLTAFGGFKVGTEGKLMVTTG